MDNACLRIGVWLTALHTFRYKSSERVKVCQRNACDSSAGIWTSKLCMLGLWQRVAIVSQLPIFCLPKSLKQHEIYIHKSTNTYSIRVATQNSVATLHKRYEPQNKRKHLGSCVWNSWWKKKWLLLHTKSNCGSVRTRSNETCAKHVQNTQHTHVCT